MATRNYIAKFHRASHHLAQLRLTADAWLNGGHHSVTLEADPNSPDHLLIKASVDEIDPSLFSPLIGDVVQNFRACLDHLAYELISPSLMTAEVARASQFPIVGNITSRGKPAKGEDVFQGRLPEIGGIDPGAQAIIKWLEPYHPGNYFISHPLWMLNSLAVEDKHRLLHIVTVYPGEIAFNGRGNLRWPHARGVHFSMTGSQVERDTVIGTIKVVHNPDPDMDVDVHVTPSIAFADGVAIHDSVINVLTVIRDHIGGIVIPALT